MQPLVMAYIYDMGKTGCFHCLVMLLVQIAQIPVDGMNYFSEKKRELFDLFPENSHQLKIAPETCLKCPEHQCQDLLKYFSLTQNFISTRLLPSS